MMEQNAAHFQFSPPKIILKVSKNMLKFFPPNKRDEENFARYFEVEEMKKLDEYHSQKQRNLVKEQTIEHAKEMLVAENDTQEVIIIRYSKCLYIIRNLCGIKIFLLL